MRATFGTGARPNLKFTCGPSSRMSAALDTYQATFPFRPVTAAFSLWVRLSLFVRLSLMTTVLGCRKPSLLLHCTLQGTLAGFRSSATVMRCLARPRITYTEMQDIKLIITGAPREVQAISLMELSALLLLVCVDESSAVKIIVRSRWHACSRA